jgi:pseudouridine-5'-phosphate glycosidase
VPNCPAEWLTLAPEVAEALKDGRPVVALESTLIAHGLPYPQNLHTAHMLEETVREHGAIPATIAVLDGTPRVGLAEDDLLRLAQPPSSSPRRGEEDLAPPSAGRRCPPGREAGWGRLPGREAGTGSSPPPLGRRCPPGREVGRGLAVRKLSRRDLAIAVAQRGDGATI